MFTRAELEFKSQACLAQMKLRVVAFSMALGLPLWIGWAVLQKLGIGISTDFARVSGLLLLVVYGVGIARIIRATQRGHGLYCPKCDRLLGAELKGIREDGKCAGCGELLVKA